MAEERSYQRELDKYLGPEYISFRNTGYTEEAYIEGWVAIQMANRIFGYDGWSSEVKKFSIVEIEDLGSGRFTAAVSVHIRVTLADGTFREDIGFGIAENIKGKSKSLQKAHKTAVTDALKRAFKQFGNALGSCCNNKRYLDALKKVKKMNETCFSESNLIRPRSSTEEAYVEKKAKPKTKPILQNHSTNLSPEISRSQPSIHNIEDILSSDF